MNRKQEFKNSNLTSFFIVYSYRLNATWIKGPSTHVAASLNMISEEIDTWINKIFALVKDLPCLGKKSNYNTYRNFKDLQLMKDAPGNLFNLFMLNALEGNNIENNFNWCRC